MLGYSMFFGAPFEIFDLTFPGRTRFIASVWLTPFFSQRSVLPHPQLLSFDNHLDCPCIKSAFLTSPACSFASGTHPRFASCLFSVACALFAHTGAQNFAPTSFFSSACPLLQKQWGVYLSRASDFPATCWPTP